MSYEIVRLSQAFRDAALKLKTASVNEDTKLLIAKYKRKLFTISLNSSSRLELNLILKVDEERKSFLDKLS